MYVYVFISLNIHTDKTPIDVLSLLYSYICVCMGMNEINNHLHICTTHTNIHLSNNCKQLI